MANCTVGACVVATVDALAVVGFTVVGAVDGFTVVACVEAGLVGFVEAASVGSLAAVSAVAIFVILGLTRLLYFRKIFSSSSAFLLYFLQYEYLHAHTKNYSIIY